MAIAATSLFRFRFGPFVHYPDEAGLTGRDSTVSLRMEEALLAAWELGALHFPVIGVDFSKQPGLADLGLLTTLQAPHRIADALLCDSLTDDGTPFRYAPGGEAYTNASIRNATAVYRLCPTALVFGVCDSTGPKGGLGSKFARALVSEISGIGFVSGAKTASRIDPAGIQANVAVYHRADDPDDRTTHAAEANRPTRSPRGCACRRSGIGSRASAGGGGGPDVPPRSRQT